MGSGEPRPPAQRLQSSDGRESGTGWQFFGTLCMYLLGLWTKTVHVYSVGAVAPRQAVFPVFSKSPYPPYSPGTLRAIYIDKTFPTLQSKTLCFTFLPASFGALIFGSRTALRIRTRNS